MFDCGYKFTLLKLAKNCGFAVPILPSLILNKKNGGHNILWSAFYLNFERDISLSKTMSLNAILITLKFHL